MKFVLALISLLISFECNAQFYTGHQLYEWLADDDRFEQAGGKDSSFFSGMAYGYVTGAAERLDVDGLICIPEKVNTKQVVAIVRKYMKDNPERWNRKASLIVRAALSPAFPCVKSLR